MSADKIHLCFVFNGINYYVPFFQQSVARVIRTGDPVLKNIVRASKDLKILMGKLPGKLSINAELKQVSMYMDTASKIIQKTHLTCSNSQAFEMTTMELPGVDPFLKGTVRTCRQKPEETEPAKSSAAKKQKLEGGDEEGVVGGEDADDAEADDDHTYTHKSSSMTTSSAKLELVNKRVDTYMKEHQCVCGYKVPSAQQLLIRDGLSPH